jgi:hypothetical protein
MAEMGLDGEMLVRVDHLGKQAQNVCGVWVSGVAIRPERQ